MNSQEAIELVLKGASNEEFFERELEAIEGDDIRLAALACAVPLSFDARLASELFSGPTIGLNGGSARAFKRVTSLPFIHTDLSGGWRFTEEARIFCLNKLKHSNNGDLDSINEELQNHYERESGLSLKARDRQKAVSSMFLKAHHTTNVEHDRDKGFDEIDNVIYELKDPKTKDQARYFLYQLCERYDSVYDYRKENYYFYKGIRLFNTGRKQEALEKLQPVADSELVNNRVAIACHLTGLILKDRNQIERYFKKSIKIGEQIGDSEHLAQVWHSYGNLLAQYPESHEEAEDCYNKSLDIGKRMGNLNHQIKVLTSFCTFYRGKRLYEKAKEKIKEALEIPKKFPENHVSIAMCHNELGHIYRALGRFEDAIRIYNKALNAERQEKYKRGIRKYIDETSREKGEIESAKERFLIEGRQALAGMNRKEKLHVMRGIFKGKGIAKDLFEERRRERERDE